MQRYAWLEFDKGMWHFLTNLYARPGESTRQWSDRQLAIAELMKEGWDIVRAYPERDPMAEGGERVFGYGLRRYLQSN